MRRITAAISTSRFVLLDEMNEAYVTAWFAELNNETGPGAANRAMSILNNMLNKA